MMADSLGKLIAPLRKRIGRLSRRVGTLVARRRFPLDEAEIEAALKSLMAQQPKLMMMHGSLSACGYVAGGAETVIRTVERLTPTLVMPTHTYCYPRTRGAAPPVYDPRMTPSRVGRITDVFWRQPGTLRSIHPTHSLAARGPQAIDIIADHETCETPCGRGTPYERLIKHDAAVLMFGASLNTYTLFHTAEDAACPYLYESEPYELKAVDKEGRPLTVRVLRQDMAIPRRFEQMDRVLEAESLLRRQRLGRGELLLVPSALDVNRFLIEQLTRDPYYLLTKEAALSLRT